MVFIDLTTQEAIEIEEVQKRLMPLVVNRWEDLDETIFSDVGVGQIEYIETPMPLLNTWETCEQGPIDKSEQGVWRTTWNIIQPTLTEARNYKTAEIITAYENKKKTPAEYLGKQWRGGFESAQGIDGWARMAERAGIPTVELVDNNGDPHTVTTDQAIEVAMAVGFSYQHVFSKKEALIKQIKQAETVPDVLAISWDDAN